jgi:long-subunit acyl-CoA synthetase (AMP-forming)
MRATGYLGSDPDDSTRFTPDGWFVTDDVGRFAPDGSLEVLGRVDAMINTGGVKVDPTVFETLLMARGVLLFNDLLVIESANERAFIPEYCRRMELR